VAGHVSSKSSGFRRAIETMAVSFAADGRLDLSFRKKGTEPERMPPTIEDALYRVAQEALTNALKHALGARKLDVTLDFAATSVSLTIADDGIGLSSEAGQAGSGPCPGIGPSRHAPAHGRYRRDAGYPTSLRQGHDRQRNSSPEQRIAAERSLVTARIILVDDHPVVLAGLKALVLGLPDFDLVGLASCAGGSARARPWPAPPT
jgi:hypothetical protein